MAVTLNQLPPRYEGEGVCMKGEYIHKFDIRALGLE